MKMKRISSVYLLTQKTTGFDQGVTERFYNLRFLIRPCCLSCRHDLSGGAACTLQSQQRCASYGRLWYSPADFHDIARTSRMRCNQCDGMLGCGMGTVWNSKPNWYCMGFCNIIYSMRRPIFQPKPTVTSQVDLWYGIYR